MSGITRSSPFKTVGTDIEPVVSGNSLKIDVVKELTNDTGVTVDGLLLKDSKLDGGTYV